MDKNEEQMILAFKWRARVTGDLIRKIIDENSGLALAKWAGELWDGFEIPARQLAVEAGGEFHQLSGTALMEMKDLGDQIIQDWIKAANSKGLDGEKLVMTARQLISKYE